MHDRVRPMARLALALAIAVTLPAPAALAAAAPGKAVESARQTPHGLLVTLAGATLRIEPCSARIIHIRAGADPAWQGNYNPAVIARPQRVDWKIAESAEFHALSTPALQVRVDKATGAVSFHDPKGEPILHELPGSRRIAPGAQVGQGFALQGPVFGLGQHLNGLFDYTGNTVHLQQANRDVAVPMLVSPKGYGLLWNNASITDVDAGLPATPHHPLEFRSGAGGGVDYHFIHGPEIDDIVAGYRELTGRAPMMARWTWGCGSRRSATRTRPSCSASRRATGR
ncbi:alpha-glucosidase domain-containing protein [Pseudoduganella albidiflava]|uniref:alpha-glucosidase domain-containing protein n=1 Tax=Pseudoduganella albidiflava TaxID=321983 RepID=UPI001C55270A|nr:alpha-glucosidase domain-containing protein [Pseudoduganella albidiflava]